MSAYTSRAWRDPQVDDAFGPDDLLPDDEDVDWEWDLPLSAVPQLDADEEALTAEEYALYVGECVRCLRPLADDKHGPPSGGMHAACRVKMLEMSGRDPWGDQR